MKEICLPSGENNGDDSLLSLVVNWRGFCPLTSIIQTWLFRFARGRSDVVTVKIMVWPSGGTCKSEIYLTRLRSSMLKARFCACSEVDAWVMDQTIQARETGGRDSRVLSAAASFAG